MRQYKDLFFWENKRSLEMISSYLMKISDYLEAYSSNDQTKVEKIRTEMMIDSEEIEDIFWSSGVSPYMSYGSGFGGYKNYSMVSSIPFFIRVQFDTLGHTDDTLLKIRDCYLRVIGMYQKNTFRSVINILNPFLYIKLLSNIFILPLFYLFDVPENKRDSAIWRLIKLFINCISFVATIWIPLQVLGLDRHIINLFK